MHFFLSFFFRRFLALLVFGSPFSTTGERAGVLAGVRAGVVKDERTGEHTAEL